MEDTKLLVFDLDGTLCDCRDIHYKALDIGLGIFGYHITPEQHATTYDGLNTKAKLDLLGISNQRYRQEIFAIKQRETIKLIDTIEPSERLWEMFKKLQLDEKPMCVASNSIKETVVKILQRLKIIEFFDFYLSNEDVFKPKPDPQMYHMAMAIGRRPKELTLIIEDSSIGVKGATASGAHVMIVKDSSEVTYENIMNHCQRINETNLTS